MEGTRSSSDKSYILVSARILLKELKTDSKTILGLRVKMKVRSAQIPSANVSTIV